MNRFPAHYGAANHKERSEQTLDIRRDDSVTIKTPRIESRSDCDMVLTPMGADERVYKGKVTEL